MNSVRMPPERVDRLTSLVCDCAPQDAICYCSEVRDLAREVVRLRAAVAAERERCVGAVRLVIFGEVMRGGYCGAPDTTALHAAIDVIGDATKEDAERDAIAAALARRDQDTCRVVLEQHHAGCPGCRACTAARARIIPLR